MEPKAGGEGTGPIVGIPSRAAGDGYRESRRAASPLLAGRNVPQLQVPPCPRHAAAAPFPEVPMSDPIHLPEPMRLARARPSRFSARPAARGGAEGGERR